MAYDTDRHVTVFFGGEIGTSGNEAYFNDTWEYNGTNWTQITINGATPPARSTHAMAYDPVRRQIVLQGGRDAGGIKGDTWLYQGNGTSGTWTLAGGFQLPSAEGAMVWDSQISQVLLLPGNFDLTRDYDGGRFLWNGNSYVRTGGKGEIGGDKYYREGIVFDPVLGLAIAAGGYSTTTSGVQAHVTDGVFAFGASGPAVKLASIPSAREYPAMAYDSRRKRSVMAGGDNGQAGTGESVLEFDSARQELGWQVGVSLPAGQGRSGAAMVYDEVRGVMVLMGGAGAGAPNGNDGGRYSDTWELTPVALDSTLQAPGNVCAGSDFLMAITPGDARPLRYQWYFGNTPAPIPGATNVTYLVHRTNVVAAGIEKYTVIMQDDCGNSFSRFADVTVHDRPHVTDVGHQGATDQCPGGAIRLFVSFVSDLPATVQWYRETNILEGQTNVVLKLDNLRKVDSGLYYINVCNSCGSTSVESDRGLQVGPRILYQPASVSADPCDGADFTVTAVGVGTLHYQWRMDGVALTNGGFFTGATSDHLHVEPLVHELEGSFDVVVTDDCGPENAEISHPATLQLPTPPWVEAAMTPAPPTQPSPSGAWVSAYDENRGVLVMYGGSDRSGASANSLWEYDGATWTGIQDAYPGPVTTNGQILPFNNQYPPTDYAAVYNPDDRLVYLLGVYAGTPLIIWTWDGAHWNRPYYGPVAGAEHSYRAVYDRLQHKIMLTRSHGGSYESELLVYDPVSNVVSPPLVMQPPLESGRARAFWVYDEYRHLEFWYQNDGVGYGPATMWARDPSMSWMKLSGTPTLPNYGDRSVIYDPVRRRTVAFGSVAAYPYDTATRVFPGAGAAFPAANDWLIELPDGPPRNPAGLGQSPPNTFFPETVAFDRRRRARVAPGFVVPASGPPAWTTYESRYQDAVVFDRPPGFSRPSLGGDLSLKANAAGYGSLTYQWRHNGIPVTNGIGGAGAHGGLVSGATNATMLINGLTQSDLGNYDVIVSNKCGAVPSRPIAVTDGSPILLSATAITNGILTIQVKADPGMTVTIESTPTLPGPWSKVTNVVVSASGIVQLTQPILGGLARYYRAVFPAY